MIITGLVVLVALLFARAYPQKKTMVGGPSNGILDIAIYAVAGSLIIYALMNYDKPEKVTLEVEQQPKQELRQRDPSEGTRLQEAEEQSKNEKLPLLPTTTEEFMRKNGLIK